MKRIFLLFILLTGCLSQNRVDSDPKEENPLGDEIIYESIYSYDEIQALMKKDVNKMMWMDINTDNPDTIYTLLKTDKEIICVNNYEYSIGLEILIGINYLDNKGEVPLLTIEGVNVLTNQNNVGFNGQLVLAIQSNQSIFALYYGNMYLGDSTQLIELIEDGHDSKISFNCSYVADEQEFLKNISYSKEYFLSNTKRLEK